jgi:hypothetical protein
MKYCSQCGASIDGNAAFCPSCGVSLKQGSGNTGKNSGFKMGVLAAVFALGLLVAIMWATSGRSPADGTITPGAAQSDPADESTTGSPAVVTEDVGFVGQLLGREPRVLLTVPAGEPLEVELESEISSVDARAGDGFTARITEPISVEGHPAIPAGSQVTGHVAHATRSDKVKGRAELTLEFDRLTTVGGEELAIEAEPIRVQARSTVKKDATKIGVGAGAGALVGAIVGGKKGAAIGTAVGAGAGTGVVMTTRGEEVILPAGTALTTRLQSDITVVAAEKE